MRIDSDEGEILVDDREMRDRHRDRFEANEQDARCLFLLDDDDKNENASSDEVCLASGRENESEGKGEEEEEGARRKRSQSGSEKGKQAVGSSWISTPVEYLEEMTTNVSRCVQYVQMR